MGMQPNQKLKVKNFGHQGDDQKLTCAEVRIQQSAGFSTSP